MAIPGFFGKVVPTKVHHVFAVQAALKPKFVDIGDKKDCGFQAIAAAIINNALTRPKTHHALLSLLLEHHANYFPMPLVIGHALTPVQRFEKMLTKADILAQFIRDFAYTLRQFAVEEMCRFPHKYHIAFIGADAPISILEMRQSDTWIHKVAIEALANVLKIPVTVNELEPGKLQSQLHYGPDKKHADCDEIIIQRQPHNHYIPQLLQHDRFKAAMAHVTKPVKPLQNQQQSNADLSIIFESIKNENHTLIEMFAQNVRRLTIMINAGEVNKNKLLDVYVKSIKTNRAQDHVNKAGLQHGTQRFFEDILYNTEHATRADLAANNSSDESLIKELVHAFARDITLGQRDENAIFAQFESLENEQKTSKTLSH